MEWQVNNFLFIFVTTLLSFLAVGVAAKLSFSRISWKHVYTFWTFGITIALLNAYSTAAPRITLESTVPNVTEREVVIEKTELIPKRSMEEWKTSIDNFDAKQDKRIEDNTPKEH